MTDNNKEKMPPMPPQGGERPEGMPPMGPGGPSKE